MLTLSKIYAVKTKHPRVTFFLFVIDCYVTNFSTTIVLHLRRTLVHFVSLFNNYLTNKEPVKLINLNLSML